jgi:hypothetical protein
MAPDARRKTERSAGADTASQAAFRGESGPRGRRPGSGPNEAADALSAAQASRSPASHGAKDPENREDPVQGFYAGLGKSQTRREIQRRRVSELRGRA